MLKDNSVMKKLVASGEERVGKLVQQLMSNERFVTGIQSIVSKGLAAKGALDKSVKVALSAMSLPSLADLEKLQDKLDALEAVVAELELKVGQKSEK